MITSPAKPADFRVRRWGRTALTCGFALAGTLATLAVLSQRDRLAENVPALAPAVALVDRSADRLIDATGAINVSAIVTGSVSADEGVGILRVTDISSMRRRDKTGERLVVRGMLLNEGRGPAAPAPLSVTIRGERGTPLYSWTVAGGRETMDAGERRDFTAVSPYVPEGARDVVVRVARGN